MTKVLAVAACVLLPILLALALAPAVQTNFAGPWAATITAGPAEIPFRFEVAQNGDQWIGYFFEGEKKIASTSGALVDGSLKLDYGQLNTTLTVTLRDDALSGIYHSNRKNGHDYAFHATRPLPPPATDASGPSVAGDWQMKLIGEDHNEKKDPRAVLTWNLYLRQSGPDVSGSILRVDGDTGTLVGGWRGDTLVLSHFAGERPVLFEATLQPDGTLKILLNRTNDYVAARSAVAQQKDIPAPVDPTQFTKVANSSEAFHFRFADIDGKVYSDADPQFKEKVVILAIGGTWCPNCRDEAPFLVDLYRRYHARGLEIVGLNFEASGDLADDKPRIAAFIREFSVPYPILYAGAIPEVKEKLPQIPNFSDYPTAIYLDRQGHVARVHDGFASAATGEAHLELQRDTDQLIENLLSSKSVGSAAK